MNMMSANMGKPHPYLDNISDELVSHVRESASGYGAPSFKVSGLEHYESVSDKENVMLSSVQQAAEWTPEEKWKAANAIGVEQIVSNALGNMYHRMQTPTPQVRFTAYFTDGLKKLDGTAKTEKEQAEFVRILEETKEKMIINIVQTMHPTIFHSAFARNLEANLTGLLEKVASGYTDRAPADRAAYSLRAAGPVREAKAVIDDAMKEVMSGEQKLSPSPDMKVTVAEENTLDRENHMKMQDAFDQVVKGYNIALTNVAHQLQREGRLTPQLAEKMRELKISDSQAIYRAWTYGADSDGRKLATCIVLYDGIYHQVHNGDQEYISRKRDMRANANDQKDSVSCLIERAYRNNPAFKGVCRRFAQSETEHVSERRFWRDSDHSTVMQMAEPEQAKFFRNLLVNDHAVQTPDLQGFRLVPQSLADQTIAFNQMFRKEYRDFLKENGKFKEGPLPDLTWLSPEEKRQLKERVEKVEVQCGPEKIRFTLDTENLLFYPQSGTNLDFFQGTHRFTIDKDDKPKNIELEAEPRRLLLDVVKRLQVIDHAIDKFGDKVADRYQIANFGKESDFYSTLLLFKETGIIQVGKDENGKDTIVGKPKLALQPLLETEEDQKGARELFSRLLEDPLVLSYYKALGHADFMVGYSDGAKSAGNFASEWSIYKCSRELKELFAKKGIKVNFFHGRGRGDSRGGQFDEGQNYRAMPHELHDDMYYDKTIQSDGPLAGALSEARGQDNLASIVTGMITAKREADAEKQRRRYKDYRDWKAELDGVMQGLADISGDTFRAQIANPEGKETERLLNVLPKNPDISSRDGSRGSQTYDSMRAITVEYGFNIADAPLHYVGMNTALRQFIDENRELKDKDGNTVSGACALEVLYDSHPAFKNMIDKTAHGLQDYDPTVFRMYAKVAGVEQWAETCITELEGLRDLTLSIQKHEASKTLMRGKRDRTDSGRPKPLMGTLPLGDVIRAGRRQETMEDRAANELRELQKGLDKKGHALVLSFAYRDGQLQQADYKASSPFDPKGDHMALDTLRAAHFVTTEENRNRGLFPPPSVTAAVEHVPYLAR